MKAYFENGPHAKSYLSGTQIDKLNKLAGIKDIALSRDDGSNIIEMYEVPGAPVAFKTWWGHQYRVDIICPSLVGIGLRWLPKLGVE